MKYFFFCSALIFGFRIFSMPSKEERIEAQLAEVRFVVKHSVRIDRSANHFQGDEAFARYRAVLESLEKNYCRGAYVSRCEELKKDFSQEPLEPVSAKELDDFIEVAAANFSLLRACAERQGSDTACAVGMFIDGLDRELFLANPARYKKGLSAFLVRTAFDRVERICSEIDSESLLGIDCDMSTEEDIAAAEARLNQKDTQEN